MRANARDVDAFEALEDWLGETLAGLSPAKRRQAGRKIGMALRRSNTDRIRRNVEPDGGKMERRKARLDQRGRVKAKAGGKMFRKLRYARNMRITSRTDSVELSFTGGAARIAKIHHFGLRGFVGRAPDGSKVYHRYDERVLVGFDDDDRAAIIDEAAALVDRER